VNLPTAIDEMDSLLAAESKESSFSVVFNSERAQKVWPTPLSEAAVAQWVITQWRRNSSNEVFSIDETGSDIERLGKISQTFPGAVLALLPNGKIQNISRRASATFREKFFANQDNWPDLVSFESAFLMCLDSYSGGLPHQLYVEEEEKVVVNWDVFRGLIDRLIKSVARDEDVRGNLVENLDRISTIFLELFKNTHDHARKGISGEMLGDSVRSIHAHFYPLNSLREFFIAKPKEECNQVELYVRNLITENPKAAVRGQKVRDVAGFLELSVLDSGPGLAAKWLGVDVSNHDVQAQMTAVMECFGKGASTISGGGRGYGLWTVLQQIRSLKGFIRVRTNNVHAIRHFGSMEDLHLDRDKDGVTRPKEVLYDWHRGFSTKLDRYPSVEGALISVLLPVGTL
jgi:hypothetical protein